MDKYEYEGVRECYGSLCVSMGVYGCLRESMDKYKYVSVHECLWKFVRVYGSLWGGGLWVWDLSPHEVPRDTHKQP